MKNLVKTLLIIGVISCPTISNAQLLEGLFDKKEKQETVAPETLENKGEVIAEDNTPEITAKKFIYKCFTLNSNIDIEDVTECANNKKEPIITDMKYYEQGEDIRIREKLNTILVLKFLDDTKRLICISIEDIEDINFVKYLQSQVTDQLGDPTRGYELMKNYDGNRNAAWADYSTYEFVYQYTMGTTAYDFRVTQFGAKMKNNKLIHPYSFTATVSKKKEMSDNPDETLEKGVFYPPIGIKEVEGYTVESRILRQWGEEKKPLLKK